MPITPTYQGILSPALCYRSTTSVDINYILPGVKVYYDFVSIPYLHYKLLYDQEEDIFSSTFPSTEKVLSNSLDLISLFLCSTF
jgi:hypothetical protein